MFVGSLFLCMGLTPSRGNAYNRGRIGLSRWRQENLIVTKMKQCLPRSKACLPLAVMCCLLAAWCAPGCGDPASSGNIEVKPPLSLMLPRSIQIHPFTALRSQENSVDVRLEAKDAYEDTTKAFGTFRFELYAFKAYSPNPKGALIASWEVDLMNPHENFVHWDAITRSYVFKLELNASIPAGRRLILTAAFESPYSVNRLFAKEYEFVSQ